MKNMHDWLYTSFSKLIQFSSIKQFQTQWIRKLDKKSGLKLQLAFKYSYLPFQWKHDFTDIKEGRNFF